MGERNKTPSWAPCHEGEPRIHGLVQAFVLLFLAERPSHGYELMRRLEGTLPEELLPDRAVLYRMLRNLEREERLSSELVPGNAGPARKVYALTERGEGSLADWHVKVEVRIQALQSFIREYERLFAGEKRQ